MAIVASKNTTPVKSPRISVNKLAEYLEASPARRRRIIYDAKHPKEFQTTRYKDAREYVKSFIAGDIGDKELLEAIKEFENSTPLTDWQEENIQLSIEVLDTFMLTDLSVLANIQKIPYKGKGEYLKINGVDISVYPDLIVKKERNGTTQVGLLKLHISKNNTLSTESQKIVAILLSEFTKAYILSIGEEMSGKLCMSIDIFADTIECCPTSTSARLKNIEAACEEIALRWDSL